MRSTNDEGEEEIGRLAGLEVLREIALDAVFLSPPKGGLVSTISTRSACRVADVGPRQRVVVADEARILDAVQQHVGDAEHVRKLLLLDCAQGLPASSALVFDVLHVTLAHVANGTGEKSAGAAGGVKQDFAGTAGRCGRP